MQRVVVITGGTSGIGAEMVNLFKQQNDIVCVLAKSILEEKEDYYTCDITQKEQVESCINSIAKKYGKIDILINCAGYGLAGALELTPIEDAQKQMDTNLFGAYLINQNAIKYMQKGSTIIHIASACSLFALPYRGMYCASKAAIDMYSKCLRMELASSKINVVSICPGDVKTNFSKNRVKVYATNERYGNNIQKSIEKVEANQEKRMSPQYVAKKIVKIANKKNQKPMYIIGAKYKLLYFASKIFSQRVMLYFTTKMFGKTK